MKSAERGISVFTLPNLLTCFRLPLGFAFLSTDLRLRIAAVLLAMLTDSLDGFLARRYRSASHFGAVIDPAMDKFFVIFGLTIYLLEQKLQLWQACAMLSRDFFLIVFGVYLGLSGHFQAYQCKSVRWGKVSTALQFCALIALTLNLNLPWVLYAIFILLGGLTFKELRPSQKRQPAQIKRLHQTEFTPLSCNSFNFSCLTQ